MKQKEERGGISQSFIMGVIALVFLIIGYQTALFLHNAAVTRITANRDMPDTVYVYREHHPAGDNKEVEVVAETIVRRNSVHTPRAELVRRNAPVSRVENFKFNPNTVTVEELCRLGFSPKQAQSIDSYRKKGGRFRRKADFAKSFVVSDSIYRRLEPYIDIPLLDLNKADSAAFDALPGIGGWYASKMVEYRTSLKGYSFKEQLMEIWRFEQERFDELSDLIVVSDENVVPYPIWSLPADSLRLHPYIGDYAASGIVLYRENNPKALWTVDGLVKAGVIHPDHVDALSRCALAEP